MPPIKATPNEIALCMRFLTECEHRKTANKRVGSTYFLKHLAEEAFGTYLPNEAMIEAARRLRVPMRRCEPTSPNFHVGITTASVRQFVKRYKLNYGI